MIPNHDEQKNLVAQFIISWRNAGHFLPYEDYEVIEEWLRINNDTELLLRILSETLPQFYDGNKSSSRHLPLKLIARKIATKIRKN